MLTEIASILGMANTETLIITGFITAVLIFYVVTEFTNID